MDEIDENGCVVCDACEQAVRYDQARGGIVHGWLCPDCAAKHAVFLQEWKEKRNSSSR